MRSGGNSGRPSSSSNENFSSFYNPVCKFLNVEAALGRSAVKAVAIVQL